MRIPALIGGEEVTASGTFAVVNPCDGQVYAEAARGGQAEVDAAVQAARAAFEIVRKRGAAWRTGLLGDLATLIRRDSARLAELVTPFRDEDEAVALANGTDYALVAALWTRDVGRAHRLANDVRAGRVFVNTYGAGGGVELPFGGWKRSGYDREKGFEGPVSYAQTKTIAIGLR